MKKSQETTAETKAQGNRCLRLVIKRSIVKLQFLQSITEISVFGTVSRIKSAVNHRIYFLISRQCLCTRIICICDSITNTGVADILDAGCDISNHTSCQLITRNKLTCAKISYFNNLCCKSGSHHVDLRTLLHTAIFNSAEYDNTFIWIINRVKDQCFQRCIHITMRCRNFVYDLFQNLIYIQSCFR